eukprot:CAMPEP_0195518778 /NCGR_PEP_ID=MMETSP0794_2-20130614/13650_1 /TAXON_ID=515487 /ORGANISM="Stephanopyxis turris, Strain CCMP 815" /LENGTH=709 /DNA_ID=CAMNT_0040647803 /DNA_START=40 /DNA_END=2169 /DNA_ORIENTATION=+
MTMNLSGKRGSGGMINSKHLYLIMYSLFLLLISNGEVHAQSIHAVPGTFHSKNGYDTETGSDALCWETKGDTSPNNLSKTELPNNLVSGFFVSSGVELKTGCPKGMNVTGYVPELAINEKRRTETNYTYRVAIELNITELQGSEIISDKKERAAIQSQIILCKTGIVGFCSPYVHEQAANRLDALNITEKLRFGDQHGGTHVHAYGDFVSVPLGKSMGILSHKFEMDINVRVNDPGNFFAIAAVQFFMRNATNFIKYDMANAFNTRLLTYDTPPDLLLVNNGVAIVIICIIFVAAVAIIYLLLCTIKHRNNSVMELCQGAFLIVFLTAALFPTVGSFLLNPKNDVYCNLQGIFILIPLQFMYAITVARLWRIYAVMSPHIKKGKLKKNSISGYIFDCLTWFSSVNLTSCCQSSLQGITSTPRISISRLQLAKVVSLFTLPMVLMQVLRVIFEPKILAFKFNSDQSVGRAYCKSPNSEYGPLEITSAALLLGIFMFLLFMAYTSRHLPSFLNESHQIYNAALITVLVVAIGIFIIIITYSTSASPDAQYVLSVLIVICVTMNMSFGIIYPKLKIIWSGQKVVISKLMSDERQTLQPKDDNERKVDNVRVPIPSSFQEAEDAGHSWQPRTKQTSETNPTDSMIWVTDNDSPPRSLVLRMVGANEVLDQVTQRITSGLQVSRNDWEDIRGVCSDLGIVFDSRVKFEWEQEEL